MFLHASLAAFLSLMAEVLDLFLELRNAVANAAAVGFEFRFARPASADAAHEPRECGILPDHKPRQKILQLCKLDLQLAFPALRPLGKNVEDQLRPVDDL